jgi:O-antigen/teichoic acid export membrane protein
VSLRSSVSRLAVFRSSELSGLAGDSFYTAVWLGAVSVADLIQIALVTHVLGLSEYGRLALVMSFVVLVGQFFDVRVGTAETTFGAGRIASKDWAGATSVFRVGYVIDAVTGVLGFVIVAVAAPFVGPWLIGDEGTQLVLLFGLTLLASTVDNSSATVLRLMGRFRLLATYMTALEMFRIGAIALALIVDRSLISLVIALVVYDVVGAAVNWLVANRVFSRASGRSLVGRTPSQFTERRAMLRTIFHTNIVSYARIAQVQLPTLLLGALTTTTEVGLYKVGTAAGSMVGRIADPVYAAILPRLSRLWAAGRWNEIARLLRDSTPIAAAVVGATLLILVAFSTPVLHLIGGADADGAGPILALVGVAYAVNGALYWSPGLLFAAGRSGTVSAIAVATICLQVIVLVPFADRYESIGAALALSVSLIASNLLGACLGLRALRNAAASQLSGQTAVREDSANWGILP